MFETIFSETLKFIKCPKTIVCNSFQTMNYDEYDKDCLNHNEEVYSFTTSYFVTKPVFDQKSIKKFTKIVN